MFCHIYYIFVIAIFSTPTFRFTDLQLTYLILVVFFGLGGGVAGVCVMLLCSVWPIV